jgi:hypothetical protein
MKVSRRGLVVSSVFLICVLQVHHAQPRGPSTAEERAKVVALTRSLEQDPLAENAPATSQWLRVDLLAALGGAAVGLILALFIAWLFGGRRVNHVAAVEAATSRNASTMMVTIRRIVFVCAAYYLVVGIALHFLEPEYDCLCVWLGHSRNSCHTLQLVL